jgi:uncharacterized protein
MQVGALGFATAALVTFDVRPSAGYALLLWVLFGALGSLFFYWVLVRHIEARRCDALGGGALGVAEGLAGVVLGVVAALLPVAVLLSLDLAEFAHFRDWNWFRVTTDGLLVAAGVAVYEEVAFRGVLLGYLRAALGLPIALAVSSLAFAAVHIGNAGMTPLQFGAYTAMGVALGAAVVVTGRLWMPIAMHASFNLAVGVNFWTEDVHDLVQWAVVPHSFWTTGDGWRVLQMMGHGLVAVVLLLIAWRRSRRALQLLPEPR